MRKPPILARLNCSETLAAKVSGLGCQSLRSRSRLRVLLARTRPDGKGLARVDRFESSIAHALPPLSNDLASETPLRKATIVTTRVYT